MTTNTQWTPGPWRVGAGRHANGYRHEVEGALTGRDTRAIVARIPTPRGHPESADANARLIAAAPDLYEALAGLAESDAQDADHPCFCSPTHRARRSDGQRPPHAGYCTRARAALAKAEGR